MNDTDNTPSDERAYLLNIAALSTYPSMRYMANQIDRACLLEWGRRISGRV